MKALLRAEWIRFRRRRDLWIIGIAVLLIGGVSFLAAYHSDATDPAWPSAAEVRQEVLDFTTFDGMTQAEIDAQIDLMVADRLAQYDQQRAEWERQQAIALQKYDIVQSPFTMINSALAPIIALVLVASLAIGDEFRFGTVRTSLLAAGSRRRFLAARLISLFVMAAGLFGALLLLGAFLAGGLRLVGAEVTATITPIAVNAGVAWFAVQILVTMVLIALGAALTMLLRSGGLTLLLVILAALIELFVSALPIFGPKEPLAGVPLAFLTTSIRTLTARLGLDTHAIALAGAEPPGAAIDLPLLAVTAIIVAWGVLFLAVADRRFRTMDIVE